MESQSFSTTHSQLIKTIKETMLSSDLDPYLFVCPCAYETAWLAMVPDPDQPMKAMFDGCLTWVLNNQNEQGFWGHCGSRGTPTIDCLPATLACVIALRTWNVGTDMINKGLAFIRSSNAEKLLIEVKDQGCPPWFAVVFPGMVDLAQEMFKIELKDQVIMSDIFYQRQRIFEQGRLAENYGHNSRLLSFLEALPSSYDFDEEDIINNLHDDGSLFQSPSATARAFMATGNTNCLRYLQSLVQRFSNNIIGVPTTYPVDEELIKLCIINHVQKLGLADHFTEEIEQILGQVYKNYMKVDGKSGPDPIHSAAALQIQILKDSLAFRLLRMHGYKVFPWKVCRFLYSEEIRDDIEINYEYFSIVMFNVYRATNLAFTGELELKEARTFSRKLLEKSMAILGAGDRNPFRKLIENELRLPWMARLDHLEHRLWIEENETSALWRGKTSFQRLSSLQNDKLVHLAMLNYEFKQSIYKTELEQLKRWSKDWGLTDMGFGREKTAYCYFAVAASRSLPHDSNVRMIIAKSAIIITVTDDFFDMKGSLSELRSFTEAVRRWDAKGLFGESKIIFDALDNLVREMATKYLEQEGSDDITNCLRDIWYETILSWLTESEWSRSGKIPSMDEYLQVGMTSIATHTIVLPASCFLKPSLPTSKLRPTQYESITKLVMIIARLLNDIQSYQKEKVEGKPNSVLLYLRNDPEVDMEEAINYMREILNKKKEELLELVLIDGFTDLPKECRFLHLCMAKVFQMFFNFSNRYDSETDLLDDIGKAIYVPLESVGSKKKPDILAKSLSDHLPHPKSKVTKCSVIKSQFGPPRSKNFLRNRLLMNHISPHTYWKVGNWKTTSILPSKYNFRFI